MPSTYSTRLRFELQAAGENLNTWGAPKLNTLFGLLEVAVSGWTTKALTANYVLTTALGSTDESRSMVLKFTGAGPWTVTIPPVEKVYLIWNACSAALTITVGAGTTVTIPSGGKLVVGCDAANVYSWAPTDFGGAELTSIADPTLPQSAATRAYVLATAFNANAGILPGQPGNAGKFLRTNGTVAAWAAPVVAEISDYASDQATKAATAAAASTSLAIAFASAF